LAGENVDAIGKAIEYDPLFPKRVNAVFAQVVDATHIRMRVWLRGTGETMSCGTGACAAVAAAVANNLCGRNTDINVRLPGGELTIHYGDTVTMTGEAQEVFKGEIKL